ncbi:MAG TPA: hypothetical protein VGE74_17360 [Gemmata sp.]
MNEINYLWALTRAPEGNEWADRMRRLREARASGAVAVGAAGSAAERANISPTLYALEGRVGRIADAILAAAEGAADIAAAVAGVLRSGARTGDAWFPLRTDGPAVASQFRAAVVSMAPTELGGHPTFASASELAEGLIRRGLPRAPKELAANVRTELNRMWNKGTLPDEDWIEDPNPGQRQPGYLYRWEVALPLLCAHFGVPAVV